MKRSTVESAGFMSAVSVWITVVTSAVLLTTLAACGGGGGSSSGSSETPIWESSGGNGESVVMESDNADLAALGLSAGELSPEFDPEFTSYTVPVGFLASSLRVTPTLVSSGATVAVNGVETPSGTPSEFFSMEEEASTVITVTVTAEDGITQKAYIVTATRQSSADFAEQAYFRASNSEWPDYFGYKVALSGDTLAVSATHEASALGDDPSNNDAPNSGAVYIFIRNGSDWIQQAYLKASNIGEGDNFGRSISLDGDTLAVGATYEDSATVEDPTSNDCHNSGAVYVFTRSGTDWSQQAYLKSSDIGWGTYWGVVSLSGDTLAVGSSYAETVSIFTRTGTDWIEEATLSSSNSEGGDRFGRSIALEGDTLVVGAEWEDSATVEDPSNNDAEKSGAVYVFTRNESEWSQQAYLKASNIGEGDRFGGQVALSGDTFAVGASWEDSATGDDPSNNDSENSGAVYIFTRTGTDWSQQAYLKASSAGADDLFGGNFSLEGDTLVVTAFRGPLPTEIYIFTRTGTDWSEDMMMESGGLLRIALSGDTLVVGNHSDGGYIGAVTILK